MPGEFFGANCNISHDFSVGARAENSSTTAAQHMGGKLSSKEGVAKFGTISEESETDETRLFRSRWAWKPGSGVGFPWTVTRAAGPPAPPETPRRRALRCSKKFCRRAPA